MDNENSDNRIPIPFKAFTPSFLGVIKYRPGSTKGRCYCYYFIGIILIGVLMMIYIYIYIFQIVCLNFTIQFEFDSNIL